MSQNRFFSISIPKIENPSIAAFSLILIDLSFDILANASFRVSALSETWRGMLTWQVIGNLAGFIPACRDHHSPDADRFIASPRSLPPGSYAAACRFPPDNGVDHPGCATGSCQMDFPRGNIHH